MKVKGLLEILEDFDLEQEVVFLELGDFYDTILLGISERNGKVEFTIKNVEKQEKGPLQ